jgi:F-type H+-transporting ATPase subunit epsilon
MTSLKTGTIRYTDAGGAERYLFISGGFAEALPNKVTILAESAERRRDIDLERAMAALERAQKRLVEDRKKENVDFTRARASLERALQRVKLAESHKR